MHALLQRTSKRRKGLATLSAAAIVGSSLILTAPAALANEDPEEVAPDAVLAVDAEVAEESAQSGEAGEPVATEVSDGTVEGAPVEKQKSSPEVAPPATLRNLDSSLVRAVGPNFVVDSLAMNAGAVDANIGDGTCATATNECTLLAALQEANATPAGSPISVTFADSLGAGEITMSDGFAQRMSTENLGLALGGGTFGVYGAYFEVNAKNPVTIDFGGDIKLTANDYDVAGILISSPDVTVKNSPNNRAGAAAYVVRAANATLDNLTVADPTTPILEVGVGLLTGATNVAISNFTSEDVIMSGIAVGQSQIVDGVTITNYKALNEHSNATIPIHISSGTLAAPTQANNIVVKNSEFKNRGAYASILVNGNYAYVDGLEVDGSLFDGTSGAYSDLLVRYTAGIKNLKWTNNTSKSNQDGIWVHGVASLENAVISGNTFEGTRGMFYADNYLGTTKNVEISGNTVTGANSGAGVVYQRNITDGFTVKNNTITGTVGNTNIWIEGPSNQVKDVTIEGNLIENSAGTLIEGIYLANDVSNGLITKNRFIQTEEWLAANPAYDHNWAIRTYHSKGWSITENFVDGYGTRGLSEAPITLHTYDANNVVGNTFGTRTNGTTEASESEAGGRWFVWNSGLTNNNLQTLRPADAVFDGSKVSFTAAVVDPAEGANRNQDGPYTLHVYWTASDHAEEYLGAIADVSAGQSVSIATTHDAGFIRVQTVAPSGDVSQYSGLAKITADIPPTAPEAPVIEDATETEVAGTGAPTATVVVRDSKGNVFGDATVDAEGNWIVTGKVPCGETLTATQRLGDGPESEVSEPYKAADCPVDPTAPDAPKVTKVTKTEVQGTGEPSAKIEVRDLKGKVVGTVAVATDGSWSVSGLTCGTDYVAVQIAGELESEAGKFSTADCDVVPAPAPGNGSKLPDTGVNVLLGGVAAGALLVAGGIALAVSRRREIG